MRPILRVQLQGPVRAAAGCNCQIRMQDKDAERGSKQPEEQALAHCNLPVFAPNTDVCIYEGMGSNYNLQTQRSGQAQLQFNLWCIHQRFTW